jgi:8-amino-3,8-dideoxy-alpha-D-manno-octulosonate transaminase
MPGFELIDMQELEEIREIFDNGGVLFRHSFDDLRHGIYKVRTFEQAFAQKVGAKYALAVTSGTAALRVALATLGIGAGDEVITQSFTFVATVEAIIESRARPVITEIDETLNMDPADLAAKITHRTRAIIPVHMLGVPARMDEIKRVAEERHIPVIEDTAWGCGGKYRGRPLGTLGALGTYSFDYAKAMTTGEGGMVVTSDTSLYQRAAAYHDHGHENNPAVPRWEDTRSGSGFNYRMSELQGAVGLAQLRKLERVLAAQRGHKKVLRDVISTIPGISFRQIPDGSEETADALIFHVVDHVSARRVRDALVTAGVGTKILPEAIIWHFAGTWTHMPELVNSCGPDLSVAFPRSKDLLRRSVAIPVTVKMASDLPEKIKKSVQSVL